MSNIKFQGVIVHGEKFPLDMHVFEQAVQKLYYISTQEYIVYWESFYAYDLGQWSLQVIDDTNRDLKPIFALGPFDGGPHTGPDGDDPIVYISVDSNGKLCAQSTDSLDSISGWYIILPFKYNSGGDNEERTTTFKDWKFKL